MINQMNQTNKINQTNRMFIELLVVRCYNALADYLNPDYS
jgi:hypothetical protein